MSQKISVILTRAEWCPHCKNFEPIYETAKNIHKKFEELKNYDIKFEDYDIANDDVKNTFMLNHYEIKDKIKGYPTVFINLKNKNQKTNNYFMIDHTIVDEKLNELEQHEEAAKRFIKNIYNSLKSINSDNKVLYMQEGGNVVDERELKKDLEKEDIYKKKYLKYKSKYLKLKNTLNSNNLIIRQ